MWVFGSVWFPMMLVRTRVGPSEIHGNGLFAVERLPKGTPIWRFEPGFDHEFTPEAWANLPEPARSHTRWFSFVTKGDHHLIKSGDHACFMNHSPDPNTGALPDAPQPITTVALHDIEAGDELVCNYLAFDADTPWKLGKVGPEAPLGDGWEQLG
jgi:hypothetical protein